MRSQMPQTSMARPAVAAGRGAVNHPGPAAALINFWPRRIFLSFDILKSQEILPVYLLPLDISSCARILQLTSLTLLYLRP